MGLWQVQMDLILIEIVLECDDSIAQTTRKVFAHDDFVIELDKPVVQQRQVAVTVVTSS